MKVTYSPELADLLALNEAKTMSSGVARGQVRFIRALGFILVLIGLALLVLTGLTGDLVGVAVGLAAMGAGVFYAAFGARFYRSRSRKLAEKLYSARPSGLAFVPRTVHIDEHGVRETSDWHETVVVWTAVIGVQILPSHLLIWVAQMNAFVIPRRAFPDEQKYAAFCDAARASYDAAMSSQAM